MELGEVLQTTSIATAYRATNISTRGKATVFVLNKQLDVHSSAAISFPTKLQKIKNCGVRIPEFIKFGVDSNGYGYLVTDSFEGKSLADIAGNLSVASRVFKDIVTLVARIHEEGVVLGDIGPQSFILNDDGNVILTGVIGDGTLFDSERIAAASEEYRYYLSPEQFAGDRYGAAADVYALGMLGYWLYSGQYPQVDIKDPEIQKNLLRHACCTVNSCRGC